MAAFDDLRHLVKVYWSLFLGNIVEWYEFAAYAYLAPYLEKHIFRGSPLAFWAGFAVTFVARPLGGTVLGILGDYLGRSTAVNLSIIGMLIGTCGQGLLPTFESGQVLGVIGLVLLVALRFLQGLTAAGEISTISAYITEVAPHETLGRSISLITITANMGFLLAKTVVFVVREIVGQEAMEDWGWRIPFIFALVPGLIAIWGRSALPESEAWDELQEQARRNVCEESGQAGQKPPEKKSSVLGEVLSTYRHNVLVGVGGVACYATLQYGGFVWMQGYLAERGMLPESCMRVALVSRVLMIALGLPVGWLTDIKGVGWTTLLGAALLAITALPLFFLVDANATNEMVIVACIGVGFSLVGACGTTFCLFVVELFPVAVRGAGTGISYNAGFAIFGGLAPILAQASLKLSPLGPGFLLMTSGVITAVTITVGLTWEQQGKMRMAHVRPKPYFGRRGINDDSASKSSSESNVDQNASSEDPCADES